MPQLLTNADSNSSSSAVQSADSDPTLIVAAGTWDTATLTLEVSPDNGTTWVSTGDTLTANGVIKIDLPWGTRFRVTLSSVGGSTSVNAWHLG